ncbi:hypothetical protein ONZ45_g15786 [Pleurotus djamor]|nr:hypothetical protein ONZ45_g15786 [Pleurotus djamor]
MARSSSRRESQPFVRGHGAHYSTPKGSRARRSDAVQFERLIHPKVLEEKKQQLAEMLAMAQAEQAEQAEQVEERDQPSMPNDIPEAMFDDSMGCHETMEVVEDDEANTTPIKPTKSQKAAAARLFEHWKQLIPQLIGPFLAYQETHMAMAAPYPPDHIHGPPCAKGCEAPLYRSLTLTALLFNHYKIIKVTSCPCHELLPLLVGEGLFPCSPVRPNLAVSIQMLEFHRCLFEKALDSVNAFVGGLNNFYLQRGFTLSGTKGDQMTDPFRRAMGQAIQWHDVMLSQIEHETRAAISRGDNAVKALPIESPPWVHPSFECSPLLRSRCPACFGGTEFGKPFSVGGDFHVAVDGNFHHRQRKGTGDTPSSYVPDYIIPAEKVEEAGVRIAAAQSKKGGTDRPNPSRVPDVAVDECQHSYLAANGNIAKSDAKIFDSHGLMALVCRHDIPLFAANINTPGEGQKYAVSLIEHFFEHIPSVANVVVLYDVGCVLDRSLHKRDIVSQSVRDRLRFVTSAMHAYGHQWSCQLEYNPRMQEGLGLTDGEGVERLWSQIRMLIGITRNAGTSKRIWLLDRQLGHVAITGRKDLGRFMRHRFKNGILPKDLEATVVLDECGVKLATLASLWEEQRDSQLSLAAHAPSVLKKEIDGILKLQDDLDQWQKGLNTSKSFLKRMKVKTDRIRDACDALNAQVEDAYVALNIPATLPSLKNVPLSAIKLLLLLREVKSSIRQRASGMFFEMERLDQAVGGRNLALGTRLHQQTRKGISKRAPALRNSIRKYNTLRDTLKGQLAQLRKRSDFKGWEIPVPPRLPEDIQALQDCDDLMEDVWIDATYKKPSRWLTDPTVRRGIRAMLKKKRCDEEATRLRQEVDNMCHWLAREMAATEYALQRQENRHLRMPILLYQSQLSALTSLWASPQLPRSRLDSIQNDVSYALASHGLVNTRISPKVYHALNAVDEEIEHILDDLCLDEERGQSPPEDAESAILSDILGFDDDPCDPDNADLVGDAPNDLEFYDHQGDYLPGPSTPKPVTTFWRQPVGDPDLVFDANDDNAYFTPDQGSTRQSHPKRSPRSLPRRDLLLQSVSPFNQVPRSHAENEHKFSLETALGQGEYPVFKGNTLRSPFNVSTPGKQSQRNDILPNVLNPSRQFLSIRGSDARAKRRRSRSPIRLDSGDDIEIVHHVRPVPVEVYSMAPTLRWVLKQPLRIDSNFKTFFFFHHYPEIFHLERLMNPCGWLNAACINSLTLHLSLAIPTAPNYAVFDTYTLVHVASKVSDEAMWESISGTRFWEKTVFIIPIHRPSQSHWVLSVVRLQTRTYDVFDSFGEPTHWQSDLKLVSTLLARCMRLAKMKGIPFNVDTEGWTAQPTCRVALQQNSSDCGLWVVATVASVLRGYDLPGLQEKDMPTFRKVCLALLLANVPPPVRPSPPSPERWSTLSAKLLAFSPGVLSFDSECRVGGDVVSLPYPLIDKDVLVSPYLIEEYMKTFQFAVHCFHDVHVRVVYRGGGVFLECALVNHPCPFTVNMIRAHQCADDTAEYFPRLQPFHVETNRGGCPTREGTWTAASASSSQGLDEDWIETDTDSDGTDNQDSDGESHPPAVYSNGPREPYIYVKPPYVPYGEHVPTPECLDAPYWCLYGDGVEHVIFERLFIKCPHCSLLLFGESYPTHTCNGQFKSPDAEVDELDGAQELESEGSDEDSNGDSYFDLWEQGVADEKCEKFFISVAQSLHKLSKLDLSAPHK